MIKSLVDILKFNDYNFFIHENIITYNYSKIILNALSIYKKLRLKS